MFGKYVDKEHNALITIRENNELMDSLKSILTQAINNQNKFEWGTLRKKATFKATKLDLFPEDKIPYYISVNSSGKPVTLRLIDLPDEIRIEDVFRAYGLFTGVPQKKRT